MPRTDLRGTFEAEFRRRSYASFLEHVYEDGAPALDARDAAHYPIIVRQDLALERFSSIHGIEPAFFASGFKALCARIVELATPEQSDE